MKEESEPVCQHLLCNRFRPENTLKKSKCYFLKSYFKTFSKKEFNISGGYKVINFREGMDVSLWSQ